MRQTTPDIDRGRAWVEISLEVVTFVWDVRVLLF